MSSKTDLPSIGPSTERIPAHRHSTALTETHPKFCVAKGRLRLPTQNQRDGLRTMRMTLTTRKIVAPIHDPSSSPTPQTSFSGSERTAPGIPCGFMAKPDHIPDTDVLPETRECLHESCMAYAHWKIRFRTFDCRAKGGRSEVRREVRSEVRREVS